VPVERIIKKGRKRERGEEGKRREKERKRKKRRARARATRIYNLDIGSCGDTT
jgi:hypothetical protein